MSAASTAVDIDWPLVATAIATFIGTLYVSIKGLQRGKQKVESGQSSITSIVGASVIENVSIRELTHALQENTEAMRDQTRELQRHNDLVVMIGRVPRTD